MAKPRAAPSAALRRRADDQRARVDADARLVAALVSLGELRLAQRALDEQRRSLRDYGEQLRAMLADAAAEAELGGCSR